MYIADLDTDLDKKKILISKKNRDLIVATTKKSLFFYFFFSNPTLHLKSPTYPLVKKEEQKLLPLKNQKRNPYRPIFISLSLEPSTTSAKQVLHFPFFHQSSKSLCHQQHLPHGQLIHTNLLFTHNNIIVNHRETPLVLTASTQLLKIPSSIARPIFLLKLPAIIFPLLSMKQQMTTIKDNNIQPPKEE